MYNCHACSTLKKNTHLLNLKKIDNSTENMSGITDGHRITRSVIVKLE